MDIDFQALKERDADVPELVDMHDYFSKVKPTAKNEWTAVSREKSHLDCGGGLFRPDAGPGAHPHSVEAVP